MLSLGIWFSLLAVIFYILRKAAIKDLAIFHLPKSLSNFYTRLLSLPFIAIIALVFGDNLLFTPTSTIFISFIAAIVLHYIASIISVIVYQKYPFCQVASFSFIQMLFVSIAGIILFNEHILLHHSIGIMILSATFFILSRSYTKQKTPPKTIITLSLFYLLFASLSIINKIMVLQISPIQFTFWITVWLTILFALTFKLKHPDHSFALTKPQFKQLAIIGLLAAISFTSLNLAFEHAHIAIVSATMQLEIILSLWFAKKKYNEQSLWTEYLAGASAIAGVALVNLS